MNEIKKWFEEVDKVHVLDAYDFVIVGGFKITHYKDDDTYSIVDTRITDFYTEVTKADLEVIRLKGFVSGANFLMYQRNEKRVSKYLRLIKNLYVKRIEYTKNLKKNVKFYTKRIDNCNFNIHNYNDLMHFYKAKVEQFKNSNK